MGSITEKLTGIVYDTGTDEEIIESMILVNDQIKALDDVKKQLRDLIVDRELSGTEHNNRMVRVSTIQRRVFDKSIMRRVFDEDLYDTMLKPDNAVIKKYIKENLEDLGGVSTELTQGMIEDGRPYQVVKIEKLTRGGTCQRLQR